MPDEDLHDKSLENDQKILGRHKWRGKFSRSERRSTLQDASQGHEIEDFLYGPRSGSLSAGNSGIDGPRLDTSVAKSSLGVQPLPESQVKRKLPRKPGLRVKFSDGLPEIIGEGGDEAQLPPLSIISLREQITQRPRKNFEGNKAQDQDEKFLPLEAARNESAEAVEAPLNPCILQRRSTGLQDLVREQEDTADDRLQHRVQNPPCEVYSDSGQESPQNPGIPLEHVHRERLNLIPSSNTGARLYLTKNDSEMTSSSDSLESTNRSVSHQELPDVTSSSEDCSTLIPSPKLATRHMHSCPAPTSHDLPELIDENRSLLPKADSRIYKESSAPAIGPRDQTLRTRVQDKGDDALHEFAIRVQAHGSVFLLGLSADTEIDLERCVRVSIWWFFKGRERLEASVRGASQHVQSEKQLPPDIWRELKQAYLDLSKSWWLVSEFIPKKHPEVNELGQEDTNSMAALVNSLNDVKTAELIQAYIMVIGKLRALAASMKKNERLPPASFEIQGLNIRIFEKTPALEPDIQAHLSVSYPKITTDNDDSNARYFFPMPLGDTDRHFNYGRMFVKVFLPPVAGQDEVCIICLLSILRRRTSQDITVAIAGQDRHLNLIIQPNPQNGLAWQDVRWRSQYHTMQVRLKSGYGLDVHFTPSDFKRLWGIRDYTRIVYNTFNGTESDNLVFEKTLGSFQLFNAGKDTHRFPQEPIAGCYLRLFEKRSVISAGTGERKVHNGHRLIIITPPQVKALSFVSQDLGIQVPIIFSYLRGESGASALLLKTSKSSRDTSMILSYQKSEDRELFYAVLGGMNISSEEICSTNLALKSLKISTQQSIGDVQDDNDGEISNLHWQHLQVIRPNPNRSANGISQTVLPAQLRLRAECDSGCLVDRINLGPGELLIALDVNSLNCISLLRPPQRDMTCSFADNAFSKEQYQGIQHTLELIGNVSSVRTYHFRSSEDMHTFQALITGFTVVFDGYVSTFAISRRRMVVPIYKRLEASATRLQIIRQGTIFQLIAFFKDFSHGCCMNFILKSTDVFESFSRSNRSFIRIVDAKFALPRNEADPSNGFVSIDMPEYPSEHDDITIGFETTTDHDKFGHSLPAQMKQVSKMGSLRR